MKQNKTKILEGLRDLSEKEREEVLEEMKREEGLATVRWTPSPLAVKATFNLLLEQGEVTLEKVRHHLYDKDLIEAEKGKYNFGILPADVFFKVEGEWGANAKISLTRTGENFAKAFSEGESLTPLDRAIMIGIQPFGTGFTYLSILEKNREKGILREDLMKELVKVYEDPGEYMVGYYTSWFSRLGMIRKEKDGRKTRYYPDFPLWY